jgi:starch phosphorylase
MYHLQDVLARFKAVHGNNFDLLPEKAVFQLNDTHPTIAVAELTRLLVDVEGLAWDKAWGIVTKVGTGEEQPVRTLAIALWHALGGLDVMA